MFNRKYALLLPLVFCAIILSSQISFATTAIQPSDADLVIGARAIVKGEVAGISTGLQNEVVFSYIRLKVEEVWKGNISTGEIVLKQPGGELGNHGTMIYGMPRFEVGKKVMLYLDTWHDGSLRVHQWFLGKFNIDKDAFGNNEIVTRDQGENVHVQMQAGTITTQVASLNSYRAMVSDLLAVNFVRAQNFEQETYGDLPLLPQPPEFDSPSQHGQIVPMWTNSNTTQAPRWFEPDSNQSLTFYINPEGAPAGSVVDDVVSAMKVWAETAGSSLRFVYGGETTGCGLQADGKNTVSFNNCDNYFSRSEGCAGILAVGGIIKYTPSQSKVVNGETYYKALEGRVSFNPYGMCHFRNACDVREVAVHEIGHALGLGHSADDHATMAAVAHFDNRCSALMGDDLAGIRAMYPATTGGNGLNIATQTELPDGNARASYNTQMEARGGAGGYSWSVVSGKLPAGIQLNANGLLSGMPTEAGLFNLSVQVKDSTGKISQAPFALGVKTSAVSPAISDAQFKKKKVIVAGNNFTASGTLYIDGQVVFATIETGAITTGKKKLKGGTHTLYVVNSDGRESNRFSLLVP
jgi:hypothetical protein